MKLTYKHFLLVFGINLLFQFHSTCQTIMIIDTLKTSSVNAGLITDSSFIVEGQIIGKDSGTIKVSVAEDSLIKYVPFKNGNFYFSGYIKLVKQLIFEVVGDYYSNGFYIEPGRIKVKYVYQHRFIASGTKENDLSNYFRDTLNNENSNRFFYLSNRINEVSKEANLELYLKLLDSFKIVETNFFMTVNTAINQNKVGYYLLSCVNYHDINYGYFPERRAIYDRLPNEIKSSTSGKKSLQFLQSTTNKKTVDINSTAYQFSLKDNINKSVNLAKLKGKIVVLDFWASWCQPCIKALPLLKMIQSNKVSKDVVYISVSIDKDPEAWKQAEEKVQLPWISLIADKVTIENFKIESVPNYIVIDKKGKIASAGSALGELYTSLMNLNKSESQLRR